MLTRNLILCSIVSVALGACSLSAPSHISTSPIEVQQTTYRQTVPLKEMDSDRMAALADYFSRYGSGPMRLTLSYDESQKETKIRKSIAKLAADLRHKGADPVETDILPVADVAQSGQVMVVFTQVSAKPPVDCGLGHMSELRGSVAVNEDGTMDAYRFGCGIDRYVAEQVERPKDLLGSGNIGQPSADRASKQLEDFRNGKEFKPLDAKNASEVKL
jgi:type IV pilus biogenesis protein CpaD/CtpE